MALHEPWQALSDVYSEPDRLKGDVIYESPTLLPHTVYCWKAHHRVAQKTYIFKSIHISQIDNLDEELKTMQYFTTINHPNLVKVYEIIHPKGSEWVHYQMEYCEGESLAHYLVETLPLTRCLEIIEAILSGLSCLHSHDEKLVHRDIKPGNIFFCKDGTPKIGDYGLVKSQKWLTYLSTAGTPAYQAPEMHNKTNLGLSEKRDHRCDIYSVGVILWEMLSGKNPPIPNDAKRPSQINSLLWHIITKSTAQVPNRRFQTAQEFITYIESTIMLPTVKEKRLYNLISDTQRFARGRTDKLVHDEHQIITALKLLTFREREILKLLYGIETGYLYTQIEVGKIFDITPQRINQIKKEAIKKLISILKSSL